MLKLEERNGMYLLVDIIKDNSKFAVLLPYFYGFSSDACILVVFACHFKSKYTYNLKIRPMGFWGFGVLGEGVG